MRILLVDDEIELTEPLSQILSKEGYKVDVAHEGRKGIELGLSQEYDLVILDWIMPEKSGLEVCQEIRASGKKTPVLFLTAKDTIDDRVIGLDAGADDYLVKPFELRELLARVRALLRRSNSFESGLNSSKLKAFGLEFDRENRLAYRENQLIELSEKEAQLLEYFMQNPGQLLTHEEIHQMLWPGENSPNSNVLAALVRLLRRKIEQKGKSVLIHTVYGKGYRFCDILPPLGS